MQTAGRILRYLRRPWLVSSGGDLVYKASMALYWVVVARTVDEAEMGFIALANAVAFPTYVIVDAGLSQYLVRAWPLGDHLALNAAETRQVRRRVGLGILAIPTVGGACFVMAGDEVAGCVGLIVGAAYLLDFGSWLYLAPARAHANMWPDLLVRAIQGCGSVAVVVALAVTQVASAILIALGGLLMYALALVVAWRVWRTSASKRVHQPATASAGEMAAFGGTAISQSLFSRVDSLVVQVAYGSAALAAYTAAIRFVEVARLVPGAAARILLAVGSGDWGEQGSRELQRNVQVGVGSAVLAGAGLVLVGPQLLSVFFGPEFSSQAGDALQVLALSIPLFAILNGGTAIFLATGRATSARANAVVGLVAVASALGVLVPQYGLVGAAAAVVIGHLVMAARYIRTIFEILRYRPSLKSDY